MDEANARRWGAEEAALTLRKYREARDDGYTEQEAADMLAADRNHAATYIDVPLAWQTYIGALLAEVPELANAS